MFPTFEKNRAAQRRFPSETYQRKCNRSSKYKVDFFRNSIVSALFCLVEKQGVIATSNFPAGGDRYAEALPDAHFGIGQMFGAD